MELRPFAAGFDRPVAIRNAGDDRLFVVERPGRIILVDNEGNVAPTPFLDIRDRVRDNASERGLLGLAFHPNFTENGYFYVNYTTEPNSGTVVSRFTVDPSDPDRADIGSEMILLSFDQPFGNHNGGDLAFGPDGYLYISTGDGGGAGDPEDNGQDRLNFLGKILRIDVDSGDTYGIPADNPFANTDATLDEIWALGLRNPWRMSFDRQTGDLWIADVGQNQYEEVNFQPAGDPGGQNYGWRCYEGNEPFNTQNCAAASELTFPVHTYVHNGANGCSVTGGYVYRGPTYTDMQGVYIYADFCSGRIWGLRPDGQQSFTSEVLLDGTAGQYSSFGEDNKGELYLAALGQGRIYQLVDTSFVSSTLDPEAADWSLQMAPQPFENTLRLTLDLPSARTRSLRILTLDGRPVTQRTDLSTGVQTLELNTTQWPAGVYLLVLEVDGLRRVERIIKQ